MLRWLRQTLERDRRTTPDDAADPRRPPRTGDVLAERYALTRPIGTGGAAVVFEANDLALDRTVAVKIPVPRETGEAPTVVPRSTNLRTEAIAAMRLTHPQIARIYNYERDGEREFLVMELVEGRSLDACRASWPEGRLDVTEVVRIGRDVASALAYAHAQGVVHNDIKPHNLILGPDGAIKIVDLGIARTGPDQPGPDEPIVGTIAYLPPERVTKRPSDHRTDIYALGATLYALAHGAPPFGDRALRALWGHQDQPLPRSPHVPDDLFAVLQRAMAKDPTDRFDDAGAFERALASVQLSDAITEEPPAFDDADETLTEPIVGKLPSLTPQPLNLGPDLVWIDARQVHVDGRTIEVPGFWLDARPVTHADFAYYVAATGALPPQSWPDRKLPLALADHPITEVTYAEAAAYAKWARKRLPTTIEWLAAYRGPDHRRFPWGNEYDSEACNCAAHGATGTIPVGSQPSNRTPDGVYDLLGNVCEWTAPDHRLPLADRGHRRVMGASWKHDCPSSNDVPTVSVSAEAAFDYLGFRCARSGR